MTHKQAIGLAHGMRISMKISTYKSASGHMVTLWEASNGQKMTLVRGEITIYSSYGEMMHAVRSIEEGLKFISVGE